MLNVLAGREKRTGGELKSGVVTINGKKMSKSVRRSLGYVLQDDVFFSHLTMKQTLSVSTFVAQPLMMSSYCNAVPPVNPPSVNPHPKSECDHTK